MAALLSQDAVNICFDSLRYDVSLRENLPYIRSELFGNIPITVFAEDREALSVARDLAMMKTAQGDNFPFYVMDMGRVEVLLEAWRAHLPRVQPFYSLRCNSDPVLLRLLNEQREVGFLCTNRSELEMALQLTSQERILYGNPFWTRGNIRHACDSGVHLLTFESKDDLTRIHLSHPNSNLILRVCMNPSVKEETNRDGCDAYQEAPALLAIAASIGIKIIGISFSIGAGVSSVGIYAHAISLARRLFDVGCSLGHEMSILDIGGGFPGYLTSAGPSFPQVARAINLALDEFFPDNTHGGLRVIAEPGRYFAASTFSLITNIIDKRAVDASFVTNNEYDAGSAGFVYQTNEGFYGSFGCRLSAHCEPHCRPLLEFDETLSASTYAAILGPTLSHGDVVQPVARLPQMQIGEWLLWDDMGAYSMGNRETFGEEGSPPPTVYYFVGNERWQNISRPSTPERAPCLEKEAHEMCSGSEGEGDNHSLESVDSDESAIAEEDSLWMQWSQCLL